MEAEYKAETKAMLDVAAALKNLEPDTVRRVLRWANETLQAKGPVPGTVEQAIPGGADGSMPTFGELHELFDASNPGTGLDKVLVVAYWFQIVLKHEDLDGLELNRALKNLGHPSSNITRDLDRLIDRSPRLVMQVSKGPGKSAQKRYKLTREGIRAIERMVLNAQGHGNGNH